MVSTGIHTDENIGLMELGPQTYSRILTGKLKASDLMAIFIQDHTKVALCPK